VSKIVRYFTSHSRDYNGRLTGDYFIRVEYTDAEGVLYTTRGEYDSDDHRITWHYDVPPTSIDSDACDCARDAGESARTRGAEFGGIESYAAMTSLVEGRAFVAKMAKTEAA